MNDRQKVAIDDPCLFAFKTAKNKFAHWIEKRRYTLVLSLNSGWE